MKRPPRSRYFHLTSQQLVQADRLLVNPHTPTDVVRAATRVGLTREQLKMAVWRWRWDHRL